MNAGELVRKVIDEQLAPIVTYGVDTPLDELDADSLDAVQMVQEFEAELQTEIPDREIDKLKTVGDMVELVKRYGAEG